METTQNSITKEMCLTAIDELNRIKKDIELDTIKEKAETWSEYNEPWYTFKYSNFAQPGTIIEIQDGTETKTFLIGDINCLGGVCDCCVEFVKSATVIRYKKLIDKTKEEIYCSDHKHLKDDEEN